MKYALIMGSESGLASAALDVFPPGWFIFRGDIRYEKVSENKDGMCFHLDVTDRDSMAAALELVSSRTDRLDLVTSFAGIVTLGSMVELPVSSMERIMDVNFLSVYRMVNMFFPLLENAGGRIVLISSEYGQLDALPIHGYYAVSKHALEVYGDSLRRELLKSGVSVAIVRPGAFKTSMQAGIERQFDTLIASTRRYGNILRRMRFLMVGELRRAKDPAVFARTYRKAAFSSRPKRYYCVGNSFRMKILSSLPSFMQDAIFRFFL